MAQLPRHLFSIAPRLLLAGVIAGSYCCVAYITLRLFAAPYLLNTRSAIPTYAGFYLWYPSLTGKVSNLRCLTNGQGIDGYRYYCRFKMKPSNAEQFVREWGVSPNYIEECDDSSMATIEELPSWWRPSDLKVGGKCYISFSNNFYALLYSPTQELVYLWEAD